MLSQCFGLICIELLPASSFLWLNNRGICSSWPLGGTLAIHP